MASSGRKDKSHKNSFASSSAYEKPSAPANYTPDALPEYNWKADKQPMELPDFGTHIAVSKAMAPAYVALMADIIIAAGYAQPVKKSELVKSMMEATGYKRDENGVETFNKNEFQLGGVGFRWRVKKESTCEGKVVAAMKEGKIKDKQDIGDYLACKLIGETIDDVVRLRNAARLVQHRMTSRRCEYSYPSKQGFRSHKSHHEVDDVVSVKSIPPAYRDAVEELYPSQDGMVKLAVKGELMIIDRASENIEQFTHSLKNAELSLESASHDFAKVSSVTTAYFIPDVDSEGRKKKPHGAGLPDRMSKLATELAEWRTYFNDVNAYQNGLDALTLPGEERGRPEEPSQANSRTKSIVLNNRFIPQELESAIVGMLGSAYTARVKGMTAEHVLH